MVQNKKTTLKPKAIINNKTKSVKRKKQVKKIQEKKKVNPKLAYLVTFFSGVLLIISTYAWLSSNLNVKIDGFKMIVSNDSGLFISLDGVEFSDTVEISIDSVINDIEKTYPQNTNQWSSGGLWPVSSNGIKTPNDDKFAVYQGEVSKRYKSKGNKRFLNTALMKEEEAMGGNIYIAFDMFLKNVSGSPKSDNLFLDDDTAVNYSEDVDDEVKQSMTGIMNSMRIGLIKIGSVSSKSDVKTIQNIKCNNNCRMVIYEPNSTSHSSDSIAKLEEHGITLIDGVYRPTYAIIKDGTFLQHTNGQEGSNIPLDTEHFALQNTMTDFDKTIFPIPNGITKVRAYVWIEGQDMDSLETNSKGAGIDIVINLRKDLAGYE
jgi:hypothetical protein